MGYPFIQVDLAKITGNTKVLADKCRAAGIAVAGVTKSFCADPWIARAMIRGGVTMLADARVQNLKRLRESGIQLPLLLLREPMPSQAAEVVRWADYSVVSEEHTLRALSRAAVECGKIHKVLLMVEMGDRREGVLPQNILPLVKKVLDLPGLLLEGLGVNFACFCGVRPSREALQEMTELLVAVNREYNLNLTLISGGNSANVDLLESGGIPSGINHLRIGEAILLGTEPLDRKPIAGASQDAFRLCVEVVELQEKPSAPKGETAQNAFGEEPVWVDKGVRRRALGGIGRQDLPLDAIFPCGEGIEVLGGSSDYLIMDVTEAEKPVQVGDCVWFALNYASLAHGMISPYVETAYLGLEELKTWAEAARP